MSILTEPLPDSVVVDGISYAVNTDFRVWIRFENIMLDREKDNIRKLTDIITCCIDSSRCKRIPENIGGLISELIGFHGCFRIKENADTKPDSGEKKLPIFNFEADAPYIYGAFLSQYGIDLIDVEYLHWFKFDALFHSLEEQNKIIKIIGWRDMDISKIKDSEQRSIYRKLKDAYSLPDTRTQEERDRDNAAELSKTFFNMI